MSRHKWAMPTFQMNYSQQQNALGYNLSMQGIGDAAIDGPRFEEFLRSRKDSFEVSQGGVSQGGLARILLLGCTAGLIYFNDRRTLKEKKKEKKKHGERKKRKMSFEPEQPNGQKKNAEGLWTQNSIHMAFHRD